MRIRPQLEVPNVKSGAPVVNQVQAGTQSHFDAALLQAAQIVSDSEAEGYGAMSPRVQQALSSALELLNQKTPSQLQALAKQPQGLAALTASLAQTDGLNTAQTSQLNKLLMLALPRLLAYKTNVEVPGQSIGAATTSTGGAQPGPQGGTPAVTAFPADFFSTQQHSSVQGSEAAPAALSGASGSGGRPSSVPGLDSTSVGQGFLFGAGQAGAQSPLSGLPVPEPLSLESGAAPVFSVAVNSGEPQLSQSSVQSPAPGLNGAGQNTPAAGASGSSQPGTVQGQAPSQGQGAPLVSNQNGTTDTGFPVLLDMDAQLLDNSAPIPIQAGSQVTLRGDGTWVLPEGASASSTAKIQAPASQQAAPQASSVSGTQEQEPAGTAEQAVLTASVPQASVPQATGQAGTQGDGQAPQVQASGLEDPVFLQELADAAGSQDFGVGTQGPGGATQQSPQTAAQQGQPAGNSQVLGSQQLVAQLPSMMQAAQTGGPQGPSPLDGTATLPNFDPSGAQGNSQASAGSTAAQQGSSQAGAFGGALAGFGQNPMQSLADQAVQDYGAQKNLCQQISNALNEAGGANPGRLVIQLSPASLGDVQVDLSMVDGKLTAHLVTSQQDVRDVLARDLSGFKAGLESHGIIVNEVSVAVRSGVGEQNQGSPEQASQNWWRNLPKTDSAELPAVPGGVSAYTAGTGDAQQGFSALA
jgi:flagellar hook-length control protein FliK